MKVLVILSVLIRFPAAQNRSGSQKEKLFALLGEESPEGLSVT